MTDSLSSLIPGIMPGVVTRTETMLLLLLYFSVAIVISFLCSLWEAVLLSITPAYTRIRVQEGHPIGKPLTAFKDNIDQPLAAILTLNTIAHTVGAIGVGQQASVVWGDSSPWITGLLIPALVTLGILVFSELIPKTLGATHWQRLVPFTVHCLIWVIRVLKPLIVMSQMVTRLLKKDKNEKLFTRTDFLAMAEIGAKEGVIDPRESELIRNLLSFQGVRARDAMTPRPVVRSLPESMTLSEFLQNRDTYLFSRLPIHAADDRERITGYVLRSELLSHAHDGELDKPVNTLRRPVDYVSEDHPIPDLLSRFLSRREHLAIVIDDFGGLSGVLTMEDIIETLLGLEIVDESDRTQDMQALARRNWEVRARRHGLISLDPKGEPEASE